MSYQLSAISQRQSRSLSIATIATIAAALVAIALSPALSVPGSPFPVRALQAQETGLPVGTRAPVSTIVQTLDGKQFDLGQYVGKTPVLLEFWATWCPNCKELEPTMDLVAKKYAGKMKFVAVAVSVNQSPERVKLYAEKHALPLEVYFDTKGNAADAYDAAATSYIVVLSKAGTVVYTGLGGTQNLEAAVKKGLAGG
jgi:thiol-disulfide isomerase/thioredoxin